MLSVDNEILKTATPAEQICSYTPRYDVDSCDWSVGAHRPIDSLSSLLIGKFQKCSNKSCTANIGSSEGPVFVAEKAKGTITLF